MGHALNGLMPGRADPLAPHARASTRSGSRGTTMRDRDPERDGEPARGRRDDERDLGREAFDERCWACIDEYGGHIMRPVPAASAPRSTTGGALHDGRRLRERSDAFLRSPPGRGLVYRDNRIVNWCPAANAVSDLEVDHIDVDDTLTYVRYPLADGSGHVTIATVRPATILADVAVAVNPDGRAVSRPGRQGGRRPASPSGACPSSPTSGSSPSSGRGRSRSRPGTTRSTSRSAATTACPSRW